MKTTATAESAQKKGGRGETILTLAVDVAAPLVLFYGLRAAGAGQWLALILAGLPPVIRMVHTIATKRRVDMLALFIISVGVLSVATSFMTGSPRFLLAKDGWMTAIGGLWILGTLLMRTPFYLQAIRSVLSGPQRERVETGWRVSPTFRHNVRGATVIWGGGLVLDAVIRVVIAYALPVDQVPLINGLQYVVVFTLLEFGSRFSLIRKNARVDLEINHAQQTA
jgi:hypothetical protein